MTNLTHSESNATPQPAGNWKTWAVAGALAGLAAANGFLFWRSSNLETEMARLRATQSTEVAMLRDAAQVSAKANRESFEDLAARIQTTQSRAASAATSALNQAKTHAATVEKKAEEMVQSLAEQHKAQQAEVAQALGAVRQTAETNSARVGEVISEVGTVKTEVAKTKTSLDTTIAELRTVRGDLGVQSGLIATNMTELAALKQLGERNYFDFNLAKSNTPARIGNIALVLRKTDLKKNQYSLEVIADDKRVEKKDRTVAEPVQFYVSGARMPYELVVMQVSKDRVTGYLSTPKVMQARR